MKKIFFWIKLLVILFVFISCNRNKKIKVSEKIGKVSVQEKSITLFKTKPKGNYDDLKNQIINDKAFFQSKYKTNKQEAIDSASRYLQHQLLNKIVPHWYGTTWDFNGYTNIPNNGKIACGYFVSTTLKHLDFKLNRYRMAQQAGLNIALSLQPKSELKTFSRISFKVLKQKLNNTYLEGVYFVGLDNHVGYVIIKNKEIYFLHSSYCDNKVVIELAEKSPCFRSNLYVFAKITSNIGLIEKWILNKNLKIVTK